MTILAVTIAAIVVPLIFIMALAIVALKDYKDYNENKQRQLKELKDDSKRIQEELNKLQMYLSNLKRERGNKK